MEKRAKQDDYEPAKMMVCLNETPALPCEALKL